MNKKLNKNKGITLISLVITIIVMLILVGVSITLAVNGGLFEYAGNAVGDTRNAMEQEQNLIDEIIDKYIVPNVKIEGNNGEMFSQIYTETKEYSDGTNTAWIPAGFSVGVSEGINKIETGLVIRDKDGNEFVWVPCTTDEKNTSVTKYAQDKQYNNGTTEETSKQYEYSKYNDWTDDGGNKTSVGKYGGFYVARYEAGIPSDAPFYSNTNGATYTYSGRDTDKYVPVSKKNNPSWNGISQTNAVTVSTNMYKDSSSVESSLIDSYAWDTIVNWMESKVAGIATNSTNYGNYVNSTISLTDVLYAKHVMNYSTEWTWKTTASTYVKGNLEITSRTQSGDVELYELATGSTEKTKVLNIYDMAGNMWEWTTEIGNHKTADGKTSTNTYAVRRGGGFNSRGNSNTVASRYGSSNVSHTSCLSRFPCGTLCKVAQHYKYFTPIMRFKY